MATNPTGANTTTTPGKHAFRQGAGEEDGQARVNGARGQEEGASEEPH